MDRPPRHPLRVPLWPRPAPPAPPDFAAIRAELGVPEEFPAAALAEAEAAAARPPLPELDATDIELVTLDPPGSRDLDQAVHLAARGSGFRVTYAIADVGGFVRLRRAPDHRGPLRDRGGGGVGGAGGAPGGRGAPPRADRLLPRPAHPAAPDRAQRGRGQPAAGPGRAGRRLDPRPRRRRRADRLRPPPGPRA